MNASTYLNGAVALTALVLIMTFGSWYTAQKATEPISDGHVPEVVGVSTTTTPSQRDENKPSSEEAFEVFASIPYWDQAKASAVFRKNVEVFDYVSVFWYRLDESGDIRKYTYAREDAALVSFAQQNGVKVLALIANLPEDEGTWDPDAVDTAIGDANSRAEHVRAVTNLVVSKGFDGVNIDYEMLRDSQGADFSAFISELAIALHDEGKILAVAIHAQVPGGETRGQDLVALQTADILSFMTYDEHWDTSEPGPPASITWVRTVLAHARSLGVDMKKVFMGIPLYGYDWPEEGRGWGTATGREYEEIVVLAEDTGTEIEFDTESQTPHIEYETGGVQHEVWFENAQSFRLKYELAKEFGVGGVMLWRQGREDARIYDVLGK